MFDRILCGREIRGLASILPDTFDQDAIARATGVTPPLAEVPVEQCDEDTSQRFWRALMTRTEDPTLPLLLGSKLPFGTYEVVDYLTSSCPTVGSAFERLKRYFGLI
ncbi:MAG: AraC family transcriptional regulator ligand-binding domain-containing protein, partial [Myxococcota bacterium]